MPNDKFGLRQTANVVSSTSSSSNNDRLPLAGIFSSAAVGNSNNNDTKNTSANQESYVIAKYDYQSQGPQELSIKKGDRLLLLDDSRHWWRVLNSEEATGFVPSNYVKREKQSIFDSIRRGIRGNTKSSSSKKSPLVTHSKSQSSDCPLLPISNIEDDAVNIAPILEQDYPIGKSNNNDSKSSDNQLSHSNILVRELGPNFNLIGSVGASAPNSGCHQEENNNPTQATHQSHTSSNMNTDSIFSQTTFASVRYNYKSQQADELSLTKGAKLRVLEKSDDGWWKGDLDGQVGWFPSNYVIEQAPNNESEGNRSSSLVEQSQSNNHQASYPMNNDPSMGPANSHNSQLSGGQLAAGGQMDRNLSLGLETSRMFDPLNNQKSSVLFVVVALYSFQAQSQEELSFSKDEHLDIVEKPANDPDWWRARSLGCQVGLVPKNYVQIVPNVKCIRDLSSPQPRRSFANGSDHHNGVMTTTTTTQLDAIQTATAAQASHSQSNGNSLSHDGLGPSSTSTSQALNHPANFAPFATSITSQLDDNARQQPQGGEHANEDQANLAAQTLAQLTRDLEIKLHLDEKDWYHGVMSRQQCDQLLNAYADDGDFLIRNSETNAGDFSVSLKAPIRNKHFRVHYLDDGFCIGQRRFESLDELVEHYKRTPIYTSATGDKMFLKRPFARQLPLAAV